MYYTPRDRNMWIVGTIFATILGSIAILHADRIVAFLPPVAIPSIVHPWVLWLVPLILSALGCFLRSCWLTASEVEKPNEEARILNFAAVVLVIVAVGYTLINIA